MVSGEWGLGSEECGVRSEKGLSRGNLWRSELGKFPVEWEMARPKTMYIFI